MGLLSEMRRVFGQETLPSAVAGLAGWMNADVSDLASLGYPTVYQSIFFLTPRGRERWRSTRRLLFSPRCCVCDMPTSREVGYRPGLPFSFLRWRRPLLSGIPNCACPACKNAGIVARIHDHTRAFASITIRSRNLRFVKETRELCITDGDYEPPWVVFPRRQAHTSWNQGTDSFWMRHAWKPFWTAKSEASRLEYLDQWAAPREWREALSAPLALRTDE